MPDPAQRPATYADILALPENMVGEIIDGVLYASPRPAPRHSLAASQIGADLILRFGRGGGGGPGGWWILDEPELHLGSNVLVPDVGGWRRGRLPRIPDEAYFTLAPDWVCEVLSPSSEKRDRIKKKRLYARAGVEHYWLVNPVAQTVEVLRRAGELWQEITVAEGNEVIRAEPFAEIEIDLSNWWVPDEA